MKISICIDLRKRCLRVLLVMLVAVLPVRAFSDGSTHLDQAFGKSGVIKIVIGTGKAWGSASKAWAAGSATQSDGKIVIAASLADSSFAHTIALARVSPDGEMDEQFGNKGVVNTQIGLTSRPVKIAVLPDGRIVVAGWSHVNQRTEGITVVMYKPDGSLDERFADDGVLIFPRRYSAGYVHALAIQPDGKIVVGGKITIRKEHGGLSVPDDFLFLARVDKNGSIDTSFGENGAVVTDVGGGGNVRITTLAFQRDGKIVASGTMSKNPISKLIVARYNPSGSLDKSFGNEGMSIRTIENGTYKPPMVSVLPDGRIYVISGHSLRDGGQLLVFRLQQDGSNDTTFGKGGIVIAPTGLWRYSAFIPVLQPDGKILVCGLSVRPPKLGQPQPPFYYSIGVARFLSDGLVDSSFGVSGTHVVSVGSVTDSPASMTVQEDGRIVIVGHSDDQVSQQVVLIRLVP